MESEQHDTVSGTELQNDNVTNEYSVSNMSQLHTGPNVVSSQEIVTSRPSMTTRAKADIFKPIKPMLLPSIHNMIIELNLPQEKRL